MPVINIRHGGVYNVYIGRKRGGVPETFGNPVKRFVPCIECGHTHYEPGSTLECYEAWLVRKLEADTSFAQDVLSLRGKVLGCFCAPNPCHGQVLLKHAQALHEQSNQQ